MKISAKSAVALVAGMLYAASANAAVFVQAATGHPHLSVSGVNWNSEWTQSGWTIVDGRSIGTSAFDSDMSWDTPIPITATNVTWSVLARQSGSTFPLLGFTNRICTFDIGGNFFSCGATVAPGATSQATVPVEGSAYSQTFWHECQPGNCPFGVLAHIKAF